MEVISPSPEDKTASRSGSAHHSGQQALPKESNPHGHGATTTSNASRSRGHRSAALLIANSMKIALIVLWVVVLCGALALDIVVDVFQSYAPQFPLVPIVATSIGLSVLCTALVAVIGHQSLRRFRFFQPFAGGQAFVALQASGYSASVIAAVLKIVLLEQLQTSGESPSIRYGAFAVLGCFATVGQIFLFSSLSFFLPPSTKREWTAERAAPLRAIARSPYREFLLIALSCAIIIFSSIAAEHYRNYRPVNVVVIFGFVVLSELLLYLSATVQQQLHFCLFVPYLREPKLALLQGIGVALLSVSLYGDLLLYNARLQSPPSWHLGCGLIAVTGLATHLLLVHLVSRAAVKPTSEETQKKIPQVTMLLATVTAALLSVGIYLIILALTYEQAEMSSYVRQGLRQLHALLSIMLFLLPLITHLQGRLHFGRLYAVWMPFEGNMEFVLVQTAGWTMYAAAIFLATLQFTETSCFDFVLLYTICLLFSQILIHISLFLFSNHRAGRHNAPDATETESLPADGGRAGAAPGIRGGSPAHLDVAREALLPSVGALVLNRDLALSVVFGVISLVTCVVCDAAAYAGQPVESVVGIPAEALTKLSNAFALTAPLIAQFSMRDRLTALSLFSSSSEGYIALQTLGWALYSVLAITTVANASHPGTISLMCTRVQQPNALAYTGRGLLFLLPLVCVVISDFFETHAIRTHRATTVKVGAAVKQLKAMLHRESAEGLHSIESLLHIIAGPRWEDGGRDVSPTSADGDAGRSAADVTGLADVEARKDAAHYITTLLCMACLVAFLSAAFISSHASSVYAEFVMAGMVILTFSCFSLHYSYGNALHGQTGKYSLFMPFVGGKAFVLYQVVGWVSYTMCSCLTLVYLVNDSRFPLIYIAIAVLSVVAQVSLYVAVPLFDASKEFGGAFVRQNAEGLLAVFTLLGTSSFVYFYNLVSSRARRDASTPEVLASSLAPVILSSVSLCVAVPLGLLSLRRQVGQLGIYPSSFFQAALDSEDDLDDTAANVLGSPVYALSRQSTTLERSLRMSGGNHDDFLRRCSSSFGPSEAGESQPQLNSSITADAGRLASRSTSQLALHTMRAAPRRRSGEYRRGATVLYAFAVVFAFFTAMLMPFAVALLGYSCVTSSDLTFRVGVRVVKALVGLFIAMVLLPMVFTSLIRRSSTLRNVHSCFCCWAIYSIPTYTVVGGLSPPLFVPTRGAWLFTINMCAMSCLSLIPKVFVAMLVFSAASCGYFMHYHFYYCLREQRAPFVAWQCAVDIGSGLFWVLYGLRYCGEPQITGRLRSKRVTSFFTSHFFEGITHYFSTRVIRCEPYVLPLEKELGYTPSRVDLNEPSNQYLFSFHPHGVFPGTAIYAMKSRQWERVIGVNDSNFVSTHCADVVFSVPIMREFPLSLGAMSVSRRGIEESLRIGNSPLIITGGQSEMLLTRMTDMEMHLVCHHVGFVKIAMRHRIPLVPIISFSECNVLDNVHCLSVQRWFLKRISFPFPVVPLGRWWLPLPTTKPVTLVVGQPLHPLPGREDWEDEECVQEMRVRYFEHLCVLFYRYRREAGYPNMILYLHNGVDDPGERVEPPADEDSVLHAVTSAVHHEATSASTHATAPQTVSPNAKKEQ